jgi:hypothetical protein
VLKKLALSLTAGALAFAGSTLAAPATAYNALQTLKQARGDAILKQLVEVRGETGQPQPQSWTILMNDPAAKGGVREFVIAGGQIASERTPLRGAGVDGRPPLDFTRLNLDSDGAFKIANTQASNAKVGFHTLDYTLRTDAATGAPLWVLHLFDYMGAPVGKLEVSAQTGKVASALQLDVDARERQAAAADSEASGNDEPSTHFKGGVFGFVERTGKKIGTTAKDVGVSVGQTVRKTTLNVAGTVQEALTGERTIDQDATPKPSPGQ